MPSYLNEQPKKPRRERRRAPKEEVRQEAKQEAKQEDDDSFASLLEEADREVMRLYGGMDINAVESRNKLTILQYQIATLKSVLSDVSRVDVMTNKGDVYALNSLATLKLKALKAQSDLMSTLKAVGML